MRNLRRRPQEEQTLLEHHLQSKIRHPGYGIGESGFVGASVGSPVSPYNNIDDALNEKEVVLDVAVPPAVLLEIVKQIPKNSICQLQKPVGNSLEEARKIKQIVKVKKCILFIPNFQILLQKLSFHAFP